jgi:Kef-type K+ transport system membrane component KefB
LLLPLQVYLAVLGMLARRFPPRILAGADRLPVSESLLAGTMVIALVYAWTAEVLGEMALITATFLAGILVADSSLRHLLKSGVHRLVYGFFVPILFVNIGLHANIKGLRGPLLWLTLVIVLIPVVYNDAH